MIRNRKIDKYQHKIEKFIVTMNDLHFLVGEDGLLTLCEHKLNKNYAGKSRLSKMLEEMREHHDIFDDLFD